MSEPTGRLRQIAVAPPRRVAQAAVYVDASYVAGIAGIAVVGAIGDYTQRVRCHSSLRAEHLALELALSIARATDERGLVFRTDCCGILDGYRRVADAWVLDPERGWTAECVPRSRNGRAHDLANIARLPAAKRGRRPRRTREWLEAHPAPRWTPADREQS